jgi:hypothetical protein
LRHIAELAQREWGLTWDEIEATWTDEYLYLMVRAYADHVAGEREWELEKLRALIRAWGGDIREPAKDEQPVDRYERLRRWGGKVEFH